MAGLSKGPYLMGNMPEPHYEKLVPGLLFSLGPSLVQLFVVFPLKAHQGVLGLQLGALTPLFVLFYSIVWGIAAGWWLQLMGRNED